MSRAGQHQSGTSDEPRRQAGAGVRVETAPWHSVAGGALCGGPCADYDAVDAARRADRVQGVDRQLGLLASTQPGCMRHHWPPRARPPRAPGHPRIACGPQSGWRVQAGRVRVSRLSLVLAL